MHTPPEFKASQKLLTPTTGGPLELVPAEAHSRLRPSRYLMKFLPTSWPNAHPCMMHVDSSQLPLKTIPLSCQSNMPILMAHMDATWRKPLLPKCEQSPEAVMNQTNLPPDWTLLERMGLGNQMLMARLRLPIKTSPSLTHLTSSLSSPDVKRRVGFSDELAMIRGMIRETLLGIGIDLGVDCHGRISMRELSPWQEKPISCKTLTSPTSSEHSRILSHNKAAQISCPSSGEMSCQTNKVTSVHSLRTNTQESQPTMKSLILVMTSSFQQREPGNPRLRWSMTRNGISHGRNIQWWFYGPIHTDKESSALMGSTSLANSSLASIFPLTLNMTKPHKNSSMATRICALPTLTNSPSLLTGSSYCVNEEVGYLTTPLQVPVKVVEAGGTRGNDWEVPQNPLSAVISTEQLDASGWIVNSAINAPAAPQAATLKPTAHAK